MNLRRSVAEEYRWPYLFHLNTTVKLSLAELKGRLISVVFWPHIAGESPGTIVKYISFYSYSQKSYSGLTVRRNTMYGLFKIETRLKAAKRTKM